MSGEELDVLVVGAGFAGVHQLHHLRKLGFKVKGVEAACGLGGIWRWSTFPGARVDSEVPYYEFSYEELWRDFQFKERYPTREEILRYFEHVDEKWDISKDIYFNTRVVSATFDVGLNKWVVKTENGREFRAQFLDICIGYAAKPYVPQIEGMKDFKGSCFHSNNFPLKVSDFSGKKVAVVGTGGSGVQVIQTIGPLVSHLTVFQRTPNLALPMGNYPLTDAHHDRKAEYPQMLKKKFETYGGIGYEPSQRGTFEDSVEVRQATYEKIYNAGNFEFWVGGYGDIFFDEKANKEAYDFWCKKTRARLNDPAMQDLLAPLDAPHFFGCRRPSLEMNYYEVFNQPNVSLIDAKRNPIVSFTPSGVRTQDGTDHCADIVVLATGFDAINGGTHQIEIRGVDGTTLEDKFRDGAKTYFGLMSSGFPNLFFICGTHGPTALSNGPTCLECQGDMIVKLIAHTREIGKVRIDVDPKAEGEWSKHVQDIYDMTLYSKTVGWYSGANIPGKRIEALNYAGGVPMYMRKFGEKIANNYEGFVFQ